MSDRFNDLLRGAPEPKGILVDQDGQLRADPDYQGADPPNAGHLAYFNALSQSSEIYSAVQRGWARDFLATLDRLLAGDSTDPAALRVVVFLRLHGFIVDFRNHYAIAASVLPDTLRDYLQRAGVTRADLFASDETRKAITFHDLRATGITWCAMRGDDPLKIMQRAGHSGFETTRIHLREAENLARGFGVVFPPLPAELLRKPASTRGVSASVSALGVAAFATKRQNKQIFAERAGFEPAVEF